MVNGPVNVWVFLKHIYQRWSPRGHILKSLASKVKSLALASRPQVLENWPVLGSRTALFFELLKFCGDRLKNFWEDLFFFFGDRLKNFCEDLFFSLESTCACVLGHWPRAFLSLASRVSVLGKAILGLGFFLCPWPQTLCPRLHLWYLWRILSTVLQAKYLATEKVLQQVFTNVVRQYPKRI